MSFTFTQLVFCFSVTWQKWGVDHARILQGLETRDTTNIVEDRHSKRIGHNQQWEIFIWPHYGPWTIAPVTVWSFGGWYSMVAPSDPSHHFELQNLLQTSDHKGGLGRLPHSHLEKNHVIWAIWLVSLSHMILLKNVRRIGSRSSQFGLGKWKELWNHELVYPVLGDVDSEMIITHRKLCQPYPQNDRTRSSLKKSDMGKAYFRVSLL